jgi:hypothetical protein
VPKKKPTPSRPNSSPYLALLDIEVGGQRREPPPKQRGRPKKGFTRKHINITITEVELEWLDKSVKIISDHIQGNISRGLLVAFMSARLYAALQTKMDENGSPVLPESVTSLETLSNYLDELCS